MIVFSFSAGFYWSFRPYSASSFYSRLPWSGQCRGGHFAVGFPWKRKAATNEWVRISQYKIPHIINYTGYVQELDLCGSYTRYIHSDLIYSTTMYSRWSSPGLSSGQAHVVVFLSKTLYCHNASLHQVTR